MERMAVRLRELIVASDEYRRAMAASIGISTAEAAALGEIRHRGPLSPSMLVRRLGIASASVTALLDRLEAAGLVARGPNPADRRSVLVSLTGRGRAAIDAMFAVFTADIDAAIHQAQPDHVAEFSTTLDRIAEALRARATDPRALAEVIRHVVATYRNE